MQIGEAFEVTVEKLAFGGPGVCRYQGLVVFVPYAVPGDRLRVRLTKLKKNFAEGEIVKILEGSPHRTNAPCEHFGHCGGCTWQNVSYAEQLKQKTLIVADTLKKALKEQSFTVEPTLASPQEYAYRNRIILKAQNKQVGFFKKNSHELIDIEKCLIAEDSLNAKLQDLRQKNHGAELCQYKIYLDESGAPHTVKEDSFEDSVGFSQVNRFQNRNLIDLVQTIFSAKQNLFFYDLYGGAGNFSLPLARLYPKTQFFCVELNSQACQRGALAAHDAKLNNLRFFELDVFSFLRSEALNSNAFVLLDPPRQGCDEAVLKALSYAAPQSLVYVSCDPPSLARDLKRFFDLCGKDLSYAIKLVQPLDMFPQTDHVETLVYLDRL